MAANLAAAARGELAASGRGTEQAAGRGDLAAGRGGEQTAGVRGDVASHDHHLRNEQAEHEAAAGVKKEPLGRYSPDPHSYQPLAPPSLSGPHPSSLPLHHHHHHHSASHLNHSGTPLPAAAAGLDHHRSHLEHPVGHKFDFYRPQETEASIGRGQLC